MKLVIMEEIMAEKRRKKKNSTLMTVLITLLSLTVVTFLVVVCAFFAGLSDNNEKESYVGSDVLNAIATESISVKINMENCTMTVGTSVQVTATIYPNGSSSGIMWTSSDPEVFTVDSEGNLNVIGEGIVALTASFGDVCDSVAIECVKEDGDGMLNLPDYGMFIADSEAGKQENSTQATKPSEEATTAKKGTQSETTQKETTTSETVKPTSTPMTQAATVKPTQAPTKNNVDETTSYTFEATTEYEGTKVLSTEIAGKLESYGFTKYLDNTYVFEENNTYSGEVIITSNMTHIYIKERSDAFDSAIRTVLTELLPESHEQVWDIYKTTATDQTVTVDGRIARVVVPADSGHSQIVIYN